MKHRAFTLIELLIVVMITAILAVGMALSLPENKANAEFKQAQSEVTNIIQLARSMSLTNILMESGGVDVETDYYLLDMQPDSVTLTAHGASSTEEEISSVVLDSPYGILLDDSLEIYYIPPYGEICFVYSDGCDYSSSDSSAEITLIRENTDQEASFTISIFSGYPEVD